MPNDDNDDNDDNDPPPIRRTLAQRIRAVVFLLVCLVATMVMVEFNSWTDWRGLWRWLSVEFRDGPARPRVKEGMTKAEVEKVLGSAGREDGKSDCNYSQYHRIEYPEYGFDVLYHGSLYSPQKEGTAGKVAAVEERK
jgi:hypothetical protein